MKLCHLLTLALAVALSASGQQPIPPDPVAAAKPSAAPPTTPAVAPAATPAGGVATPAVPPTAGAAVPLPDPFSEGEQALVGNLMQNRMAAAVKGWTLLGYGSAGDQTFGVLGNAAGDPSGQFRAMISVGASLPIDLGKAGAITVTVIELNANGVVLQSETGQRIVVR